MFKRLRAAAEYGGGRRSEDDRAGRHIDDQLSFFTLPAADVHLSQSQPAQWDAEADRRLFFCKSDNQPGSMRFSKRELLAHGPAQLLGGCQRDPAAQHGGWKTGMARIPVPLVLCRTARAADRYNRRADLRAGRTGARRHGHAESVPRAVFQFFETG